MYGWGDSTYGEVGTQDSESSGDLPQELEFFKEKDIRVKTISVGARHSVVVDTEGIVYTFGDNTNS